MLSATLHVTETFSIEKEKHKKEIQNMSDSAVESIAEASPRDENEKLSPEEREHMKQTIIKNMTGIQDLLRTYQQQHETLQQEVAEFVMRDVEEQNQMHALVDSVEAEQRAARQNPQYLRWAAASGKSEFSNENETDDEHKTWWTWFETLDIATLPPAILPLEAYPGVKQHLAGWRRLNSAIDHQLTALADDLFQQALTVGGDASPDSQDYVVFLNGLPVLDASLFREDTAQFAVQEQSTATAQGKWSDVESAATWWQARLMQSSSVCTPSALKSLISTSPSVPQCLLEGTQDFISLVSVSELRTGALCRLVALDGVVRAIEVCDPKCNVLGGVCTKPTETVDRVIARGAEAVASRLFETEGCSSQQLITTWLTITEDGAVHLRVTDARQLSPSSPYRWFLTWADICGLGRVVGATSDSVVVKRTRARLAELEPFDALSTVWFAPINEVLNGTASPTQLVVQPSSASSPTSPAPLLATQSQNNNSKNNNNGNTKGHVTTAQVAGVAVVATCVGGLLATLLLSKRLGK